MQGRQHVAETHRHRRRAQPVERLALEFRCKNPDLFALEVGKRADRRLAGDGGRVDHEQPGAMQALAGAEAEHEF